MVSWAFALDGKVDMSSVNPLEMTNFEMMGTIFGIAGVLLNILWTRYRSRRQLPHVFTAHETEDGAID
jgi:hypothetical protein